MPNGHKGAPCDVEETERFSNEVLKLAGNVERWDEIKETIELDLARNPFLVPIIPGTNLRAITLPTVPPRTIYFSIRGEKGNCVIVLESIV